MQIPFTEIELPKINWRDVLARLPLPMLALSASYGVYSFAVLYVPEPVAIAQAAAFELTYLGLAVTRGLSEEQRKRATNISIGAVAVSVLYNTLSGLFHRQPGLLKGLEPNYEIGLAVLHGAPLAIVAYLVADLLLHSENKEQRKEQDQPQQQVDIMPMLHEAHAAIQRQANSTIEEKTGELWEANKVLLAEIQQLKSMVQKQQAPAPAPVSVADLVDLPQLLEEPAAVEVSKAGQIQEMRSQGKTWDEIAAYFGKSVRTVRDWATKEV